MHVNLPWHVETKIRIENHTLIEIAICRVENQFQR